MRLVNVEGHVTLEVDGYKVVVDKAQEIIALLGVHMAGSAMPDVNLPTMEKYITPSEAAKIYLDTFPGMSGGDANKLAATIRMAAYRGRIEHINDDKGYYKLDLLSFMEYYNLL